MPLNVEQVISDLLTGPQRKEVRHMTQCGYSREDAIRRLIRVGMLARRVSDLEGDLIHGTNYVLPKTAERCR